MLTPYTFTSTRRTFGGEKFRYFMFLVGFQCVVNALIAKAGIKVFLMTHKSAFSFSLFIHWPVSWHQNISVSLKPYRLYPILAVTYVGAMVASNSALAYITYPTQVYGSVCLGPAFTD